MNEVAELLKAARKVIEKPENWTQRVLARNVVGSEVDTDSAEACRWCTMGALFRVLDERNGCDNLINRSRPFLNKAAQQLSLLPWDCAESYNDSHTHAEVLALFDKAIASAEAA